MDTFVEEEPIDLGVLSDEIVELDKAISENKQQLLASLDELVTYDEETQQQLDKILSNLKNLWV